MNQLLSEIKKWKKLTPSDSLQVVEYFGTPGSGKTFLSNNLYNDLINYKEKNINKASLVIGKMHFSKRVFVKLLLIIYLILLHPKILLNIIILVKEFHSKNDIILVKLTFNFIYVVGLLLYSRKYKKIVIMDQGIFQAVWSCIFHGNNIKYDIKKSSNLLLLIISKINFVIF